MMYAQIARACGLSKGVVTKYLNRAKAQAISWPLPAHLDEAALVRQLFPERVAPARLVEPDRQVADGHGCGSRDIGTVSAGHNLCGKAEAARSRIKCWP